MARSSSRSLTSKVIICIGTVGAVLSLFWPYIFEQTKEVCPWMMTGETESTSCPFIEGGDSADGDNGKVGHVTGGAESLRSFTLDELSSYDGSDPSMPIYLSISGKVLDVSSGAFFYAEGKSYHQFAGKAVTRAIAIQSTADEDMTDDLSDLDAAQMESLATRLKFFVDKYPQVGTLKDWEPTDEPSEEEGISDQ